VLDDNDADVHRILAAVSIVRNDFTRARYHQDRALALNPNYDLVLLRHKVSVLCRAVRALQQGHRGKVVTRASINRRRMVAMEFGLCRSGRRGGASGSVTAGNGRLREDGGGASC
jgi:hypothetical protein